MDNLKIVGAPLPDMPWEDRPEGSKEVLWRYSKNPVIPRDILPTSNSVFNSAVVPFKGGYAGVFRCDDTNRRMRLHVGFSADRFQILLESFHLAHRIKATFHFKFTEFRNCITNCATLDDTANDSCPFF